MGNREVELTRGDVEYRGRGRSLEESSVLRVPANCAACHAAAQSIFLKPLPPRIPHPWGSVGFTAVKSPAKPSEITGADGNG